MARDDPSTGARRADSGRSSPTAAQWFCLLVGLGLLAVGGLGFLVNSSFDEATFALDLDDGELINGDLFLGLFEVNGWHNIVHLVTGLVLLLAAATRASAKAIALVSALVYAGVVAIGFIGGNDIVGVMPTNVADNVLHAALAAVGLLVALVSPAGARASAAR